MTEQGEPLAAVGWVCDKTNPARGARARELRHTGAPCGGAGWEVLPRVLFCTSWPGHHPRALLTQPPSAQVTPSPASTELMTTTDFYPWEDEYSGGAGTLPELCEKQTVQGFAYNFQFIVYLPLSVVGILGNMLVLFIHARYGQAHSVTDVCLLHLALSDLLLLLLLPFAIVDTLQIWSLSTAACKALQGLHSLSFYSGFLFLTCISVDRYVAVVRRPAAWRLQSRARCRSSLTVGLAWLAATMFALPQFIYSQAQQHQHLQFCHVTFPHVVSRAARGGNNLAQVVLGFVVPFLVMTGCYAAVARKLLASRGAKPRRTLRMLLALVLVFVVLQLPHSLMVLLDAADLLASWERSCSQSRLKDLVLLVTGGLVYLRCCLNPLLYAFLGQRFRQELRRLAGRLRGVSGAALLRLPQPPPADIALHLFGRGVGAQCPRPGQGPAAGFGPSAAPRGQPRPCTDLLQ